MTTQYLRFAVLMAAGVLPVQMHQKAQIGPRVGVAALAGQQRPREQ